MKPPRNDVDSLRDSLRRAADLSGLYICDRERTAPLRDLLDGSYLGGHLAEMTGRSVLIATQDQLATALALIELDGVARRFVICPSDVGPEQLAAITADAEIDAIVSDRAANDFGARRPELYVEPSLGPAPLATDVEAGHATEWVLLTSGTTGTPKLVAHSLAGLSAPFRSRPRSSARVVWATFYDIRRYGGLQIFLRAALGTTSLVLSSSDEPVADHVRRLCDNGVTHISGTPTHWRRCIMSPAAKRFAPAYVRLSGEIADQAILDSLRAFWPNAQVGHAYASTEAGVGFEVLDGREGFPANLLAATGEVQMKVEDGSLRIRSTRVASRYLGANAASLASGDGFVDTGDMIECTSERCYFRGRRGGIINVGGSKVHPEEVEAVINRHPKVRMSLVKAQRSPITSAIVVADVVLLGDAGAARSSADTAQTQQEILALCRKDLAPYKVPVLIRIVPALDVTESGKLARPHG
jgi:acyl-coenzyme A synthetase/AMP-(fatty) acid ligase